MKTVKFIKPFGFAENGIETTHYQEGETHTVSDSCADSAVQVGKAEYVDDPAPEIEAKGKVKGKKS